MKFVSRPLVRRDEKSCAQLLGEGGEIVVVEDGQPTLVAEVVVGALERRFPQAGLHEEVLYRTSDDVDKRGQLVVGEYGQLGAVGELEPGLTSPCRIAEGPLGVNQVTYPEHD